MSIQGDIFREQHLGEIPKATLEGYITGLTTFAWWKDGVQYVGIRGTTLADAIVEARKIYKLSRKAELP